MLITYSVKRHTQVAVVDEAKFHDQSLSRVSHNEQATRLLPMIGTAPDRSHPLSDKRKEKENKDVSATI